MDKKCTKEGCSYLDDGKCIEGVEPESCPNIIEKNAEPTKSKVNSKRLIYDSEALTLENVNLVTSSKYAKVVLLAGPSDSGKTTFICSLLDLFHKGPFASCLFMGSLTLIGLEKISHDSRSASGRINPDTARTPYSRTQKFYHFSVKKDNLESVDLLFTDLSGEFFKDLRNSLSECEKYSLMDRIDYFVIFFDCDLLCNDFERHNAKHDNMSLLRTLIDSKKLNENSKVHVIFSKWDKVNNSPNKKNNEKFISDIEDEMKNSYDDLFNELKFFKIASRPDDLDMELGFGIEDLFTDWIDSEDNDEVIQNSQVLVDREFLKYKFLG